MKISNFRCGIAVSNKEEFQGSNLHGEWKGDTYFVVSYGWYPILAYHEGKWKMTDDGYSASTKRQLSHARKEIKIDEVVPFYELARAYKPLTVAAQSKN